MRVPSAPCILLLMKILRDMEPTLPCQNYGSHKLSLRKLCHAMHLNNTTSCTSCKRTRKIEKAGHSLPTPSQNLTLLPITKPFRINYHNKDTKNQGPEYAGLANQTRPKASCKVLAAFVTSPPFLRSSTRIHVRLPLYSPEQSAR